MAILMVVGPVALALFAIGVAVFVVSLAYDVVQSRRGAAPKAAMEAGAAEEYSNEAAERRIYLERGVARAFVILGGAFWVVAAFAGLYSYQQTGMTSALLAASVPLLASLTTLVVGWYWERIASVALALASAAVVMWGVTHGFEIGVWILLTLTLLGPMLTASVLFWLARRDQEALEFSIAAAAAELALNPIER